MAQNNFLDEIADYLILSGVAPSENIKVNVLVAEPDTCVALLGLPGTVIGENRDVPDLKLPRFQVITRAADFNDASDLMDKVREALHNKIGLLLPHFRVMRIHAEQDGGPIGQDTLGRSEFSINFNTEYHLTDSLP